VRAGERVSDDMEALVTRHSSLVTYQVFPDPPGSRAAGAALEAAKKRVREFLAKHTPARGGYA